MQKAKLIVLILTIGYSLLANTLLVSAASINIHATNKWAWSDEVGWIDFNNVNTSVNVTDTKIQGFAVLNAPVSPLSYVSFDCATSPYSPSNYCGTVNYSVANDGAGNLSGWAWSDAVGWVSFCGGYSGCTSSPVNYRVSINTSTGDFSGWAWNDKVGWIGFNCSTCGSANYKVNTSWGSTVAATGDLTSVTYDTNQTNGVNYNSIMWKGTLAAGGAVTFQLATSKCPHAESTPDCSGLPGTWDFKGPDNTSGTSYGPSASGTPVAIVGANHKNQRYYRYKVFLTRNTGGTSPIVTDVVVNWSP